MRTAPDIDSKYIIPALYLVILLGIFYFKPDFFSGFFSGPWDEFKHRIPLGVFIVLALVLAYYCFRRSLSLIPVLGLLTCGYLMTELGITNWLRFLLWLVVGLVLYFFYSNSHSKLARKNAP